MDEAKPELIPWPFKLSREEIAAFKAKRDAAREVYGTRHPEYRKASMNYTRSLQKKVRVRRSPSKVAADIAYQLREKVDKSKDRIAQLEKRIQELEGVIPSAITMRQYQNLNEKYGPQIMEERLKEGTPAEKWKALQELNNLLKCHYRAEVDKEPVKKQAEPRKIVVREWPTEGAKA